MSEPRSDINQLLMQIKYNFQVLWRLVDLAEDSNVNIAHCSFQKEYTYIRNKEMFTDTINNSWHWWNQRCSKHWWNQRWY